MTQMTIDDICSNRHQGNEHSERVNPSSRSKRRAQLAVFEIIRQRGGATLKEIAAELDTLPNCISGRITELKKAGVVIARGRRGGCGINFITDTDETDSFLNKPHQASSCCLVVAAVSSSYGLQDVLVSVLLFISASLVVPGGMIWMVRSSLFPRYNQELKDKQSITNRSMSLGGLEASNSKEAVVLDTTPAESLGRA